jgi:signal transduction histidine kinase
MELKAALSRNNLIVLIIIVTVATLLSILSYQYSTLISNQIIQSASEDIRSNAKIEANDLAHSIQNEFKSVTSDLYILGNNQAVKSNNSAGAINLVNLAENSANKIVDFYMWLDQSGKIVWISNINATTYQKYQGFDLSYRPYFTVPRSTHTEYYSSTIQSNDNVPRLYISYPLVSNSNSDNNNNAGSPVVRSGASSGNASKIFNGVVVAGIRTDDLGNFLKDQLFPGFRTNIAILDKDGNILYSTNNQTQIGKNALMPSFQSAFLNVISPDSKSSLNSLLKRSLQDITDNGSSGNSEDILAKNGVYTIAYQPIVINRNHFLTFYAIAPHDIASNVSNLASQAKNFSTFMITIIGAVAFSIALLVLSWNRRLKMIINMRTEELRNTNESLAELNKQLSLTNEQLKHRDKMQSEFVNVAAHELRTPIQPIVSLTEVLKSKAEDREQLRLLDITSRNARRLLHLADDILDVTRIESNSLQLNKERFDLSELISNTVQDFRNEMRKAGSGANIELSYTSECKDAVVEADRNRLVQVISNLLSNAVKFTKKGSISVTLEKKQESGEFIVRIRDSGIGIDKEIVPRLFEKFASKSFEGTGLGLFISKSIVIAHGGRIWAENNADGTKGATFYFSLPIVTQDLRRFEQIAFKGDPN